jgi:hypothetical protein
MPAHDVQGFRDSAERLVGLLTTLIYETGTAGVRVDHEGFVLMPFGNRVKLESPRQPLSAARRATPAQD